MTDIASTTSAESTPIRQRKGRHLAVCINPLKPIESTHNWLQDVRLINHALPDLDWQDLDLSTEFLGHNLERPFFISCMTGGSQAGVRVNQDLVQAAQQTGIPVGLGSMRVLLREPDLLAHFQVKHLAPDVPIWANLSAAQLHKLNHTNLIEWLKRLEVQALVLHCNVGQEQFQPQGDRHFHGIHDQIKKLCDYSPIPILVKETGFGLSMQDVTNLTKTGIAAVDIAGAGGTNWVLVESQCHPDEHESLARELRDWGNPTPLIQAALNEISIPILASGGIRTGLDIAKSLALGAHLSGLALPFIQAHHQGGLEGVLAFIETLTHALKNVMLLTGSKTIPELRQAGLILSQDFLHQVKQYQNHGNWRQLIREPS